ncbi:hypothetical protein GDO86_016357 [Hymenochirus boettgeri]|uniref:Uncharacterized protein n=1 Tax=Hymenochirus boettgeri TaxID=247094 RepID=A0A8T2K247_9PIPI|nr:hypothetical protein GDO86_016357 [Hymenochirus boettgeri]
MVPLHPDRTSLRPGLSTSVLWGLFNLNHSKSLQQLPGPPVKQLSLFHDKQLLPDCELTHNNDHLLYQQRASSLSTLYLALISIYTPHHIISSR